MAENPVERNFVTRYLLGFAVILAMFLGGGAVGQLSAATDVPYGAWIGTGVGAAVVFVVFSALYRRYDAAFSADRNDPAEPESN